MKWWKIDFEAAGLFTDGEFIRLEGGTLDIGIVRGDSFDADEVPFTFNEFRETFEETR